MKRLKLFCIALLTTLSTSTYANGPVSNSPYFFDKECLESINIGALPRRLEFSCNKQGKCFASDMFMNIVMNCADRIESDYILSSGIQPYLLDSIGFRKAENIDYS